PPFCSKCHEPKIRPPTGEVWEKMKQYDAGGTDVFKSLEWMSPWTVEDDVQQTNEYRAKESLEPLPWSEWGITPPSHAERWTRHRLGRDLYFSFRLAELLK